MNKFTAMIKSNELRIGNRIYPLNECKEIVEVTDIDVDGRIGTTAFFYNKKGTADTSSELACGISLTPEWLAKIGKPNVINHSWDLGYKETTYVMRLFDDGVYVGVKIESNERFSDKSFAWGLKYLHQLQNLYFALTGEELTIKEPA